MASGASTSDVIELVSSDEETEPAPKKIKPGNNSMVHIPHGVTIKPSKQKPIIPNVGKGITLTKIDNLVKQPHNNKNKLLSPNGRQTQRPLIRPGLITKPLLNVPVPRVNPISLMKKLNNSQIMINKVAPNRNALKYPVRIATNKPIQKSAVKNLPPSITVTRTTGGMKRPTISNVTSLHKKQKTNLKAANVQSGDILTVELDDDEVAAPSTANPQWYLTPEQPDKANLEVKNNAEPEPSKFIEITIEDSPSKPAPTKRTCEVGTELAITIEDSPVKPVTHKTAPSGSSDSENAPEYDVPHSKKKLEYPKENAGSLGDNTIEIEIEPMKVTSLIKENDRETNKEIVYTVSETIVEIEESPLKKTDVQQASTPKKGDNNILFQRQSIFIQETTQGVEEGGGFHPIYQNFIDLCFKLENSDDMKKIVEKKIKAYYRQVPKEYTESENFIDMVSSKIISMKAGPEKMYLYIKDIVDELNLQRKMAKSQVMNTETKNTEPEAFLYGEDSEFDSKRQRQIHKLEKTLKKLHRAIQKLEEQEVDFDDEEDSVYLLTESDDGSSSHKDIDRTPEEKRKVLLQRYKERMVRVHAKFCQLTNTKMPSEPRVQIDARLGQPKGPAKRLEKWINRKVPIGTPLPFPDFHDVLRCVREANDEDKIGWNEADIMEEARDLFTRCGKKLQRRRQENEWRLAASRISQDIDPADDSESLQKKLEDNKLLASRRETEVFNKYADRQSQLKLEAVEIGDKEAEESPVESEDEEPNEEGFSLENKEKRKKRLRRLIQEKSKKLVDGKIIEIETKEPEKIQSDSEIILVGDSKTESNDNESEKKEIEMQEKEIEPQEEDMETDLANVLSNENKIKPKTIEKVHSISDDSNEVDSDVDELHLLQKLHSENDVNTSTVGSSDTDTPIDISDTLHSSSDNKDKAVSGVISIENSSYSESEVNKDTSNLKDDEMDCAGSMEHGVELVESKVNADDEMESKSMDNVEMKTTQTNNDEYTDTIENILLASSEGEDNESKDESPRSDNINLRDDAISIGDTEIQKVDFKKDKMNTKYNDVANAQRESSGSVDVCVNSMDNALSNGEEEDEDNESKDESTRSGNIKLRDDAISISDTEIQKVDLKGDAMNTKYNDVANAQRESSGSIDVCVNSKDNALSIGDIETQEHNLTTDRMDTEQNGETGSVVNINNYDEIKPVDVDSTKEDSTVIAPVKGNDALNVRKADEPKILEDVDTSTKSAELLSKEDNVNCEEAQKSCSPNIKETVTTYNRLVENEEAKSTKNKDVDTSTKSAELLSEEDNVHCEEAQKSRSPNIKETVTTYNRLVENEEAKSTKNKDVDTSMKSAELLSEEGNVNCEEAQKSCRPIIKLVEIEEAKCTKNKECLDTHTSSSESFKEETDPTVNKVESISEEKTDLDDSNEPLESVENDVVNSTVDSVVDMLKDNDKLLASSDNIEDCLVADNTNNVDQIDSLENTLEDIFCDSRQEQ